MPRWNAVPIHAHRSDAGAASPTSPRPHRSPVMLLGHVVRIAHGADFRTYVAVEFSANQDIEVEQLEHEIAHRRFAPT